MKKDKQVLEMLKQDMDKRNIPDFWDKIQEQRQIYLKKQKPAFYLADNLPNDTFDDSTIVSIDTKYLHGTFAQSDKTSDELSKIFSSLKNTDVVYEDNDYIYKFDKAGTLTEMLRTHNITPSDKIFQEDIEKITDNILAIYFPKFEVYTNDEIIYEYKDDIWNINISHFYYDGKTTETTYYYSNIHIQLSPDGQILKIELSSSNESS